MATFYDNINTTVVSWLSQYCEVRGPNLVEVLNLSGFHMKLQHWIANDALGHVEQRKFKYGGFVQDVPVNHLLHSMVILYQVFAQLQKAHCISDDL